MSRVLMIIGTDWSGPQPEWVRQPFTDNGRLKFDRMHRPDWDNVFHELGDLARVDSLAVGVRGVYDTGAVDSLSIARAAYQATHPQPTLMPWFDTVGLPDIAGPPDVAHPFDFANPEHIRFGWERYAKVFFDRFGDLPLERSPRGKVLCAWWGIETNTGHGFRNQQHAQRLLDSINTRLLDLGLVGADHIVDQSWATLVPNLNVLAVHDWFNPWGITAKASSIRTHNGVTVGMSVPSFYRIINPEGNADTITASLASFRAAKADYVLLEGGTDFTEGAEFMRDATGNTDKLKAVREHVRLTTGEPMPDTDPLVPVDPKPKVFATYSISRRESFADLNRPGRFGTWYPKGQRETVLSIQGDGERSTRLLTAPPAPDGVPFDHTVHGLGGVLGTWESWWPEGNRSVFETSEFFAIPLVP